MRMRQLFLHALALAAAAAAPSSYALDCAQAQTQNQRADEDTIRRIEAGWLAAEYHGGVDFLDCLLDPGYQVILAKTGERRTKADLLTRVASNKGKTTEVPPLQTTVVINGPYATAYSSMTGKKKTGEPFTASYVDVYLFKEGAWHAIDGVDL